MKSKVYDPKMRPDDESVPIANGGTGARLKEDACANLGLVSQDQVRQPDGVITLGADMLIRKEDLPPDLVNVRTPTLSGLQSVLPNGTVEIYITNYSSDVEYVMYALGGTATQEGDLITFQAGGVSMDGWVNVNDRQFDIYVGYPRPLRPEIVWPTVEAAIGVGVQLTVKSSDFVPGQAGDTHTATDWQLVDVETDAIEADLPNRQDAQMKEVIFSLPPGRRYELKVRYHASNGSLSLWSEPRLITTRDVYIPSLYDKEIYDLAPADGINFGRATDLSEDGSVLVIGTPGKSPRGELTIYRETSDKELTLEATVKNALYSGNDLVVHLVVAQGGRIYVDTDLPTWTATNYNANADFTITGSTGILTLTGKGAAGSKLLNPGQGDSGYPDGLPAYNPGQAAIEPDLMWKQISDGDTVDIVPSESFVPENYTPLQLPAADHLGEIASIYSWVDDGETTTVYRDQYEAVYDPSTGQSFIPAAGHIAFPDGLPAYVAPFFENVQGASSYANVNGVVYTFPGGDGGIAADTTITVLLENSYSLGLSTAISADGETVVAGMTGSAKRGRTLEMDVAEGGSLTMTTNSAALPSQSFTGKSALNLPEDATSVSFIGRGGIGAAGMSVPATDKTFVGVGGFTYNKYISALRITAMGGVIGTVVVPAVGDPAYPDGLPAYVAPVAGEYSWVPVGISSWWQESPNIQPALYLDPVHFSQVDGIGDYKITAQDTKLQSGSYTTAANYVAYLDDKHPTFDPVEYGFIIRQRPTGAIPMDYTSHSIASDGKSGFVKYNKSGSWYTDRGEGGLGESSQYWTCGATISFSLVETKAPVEQVGLPQYPTGLPAYVAEHTVYSSGNGGYTLHHDQQGLPEYPNGLPAYKAAVPYAAEWRGVTETSVYAGTIQSYSTNMQSYPYSSYPSSAALESFLDDKYGNAQYVTDTVVRFTRFESKGGSGGSDGGGSVLYTHITTYTLVTISNASPQEGLPAYPDGLPAYVAAYDEYIADTDTVVKVDGQTFTFSGEGGTTVHHPQQGLPEYPSGLLPYVAPVAAVETWTPGNKRTSTTIGPNPIQQTTNTSSFDGSYYKVKGTSYPSASSYADWLATLQLYIGAIPLGGQGAGNYYATYSSRSISGNTGSVVFHGYIPEYTLDSGEGGIYSESRDVTITITFSLVQTTAPVAQQGLPAYPSGLPVYVAAYDTYTPGTGGITVHHDQVGFPEYPEGLPPYQAAVAYSAVWRQQDQTSGGYSQTTYPSVNSLKSYLDGVYGHAGTITNNTLKYDYYENYQVWVPAVASGDSITLAHYETIINHIVRIFSLVVLTSASPQVGLPAYPSGLPAYVAAYDEFIPSSEAQLTTLDVALVPGKDHVMQHVVAASGSCRIESFLTSVPSETINPASNSFQGQGRLVLPYGIPNISITAAGGNAANGGFPTTLTIDGVTETFTGSTTGEATPSTEFKTLTSTRRHVIDFNVAEGGMFFIGYGSSQPILSTIPANETIFYQDGKYYVNRNVETLTLVGHGGHGMTVDHSWAELGVTASDSLEVLMALDDMGRLLVSRDKALTWEEQAFVANQTPISFNRANDPTQGLEVLTSSGKLYRYDAATKTFAASTLFGGQMANAHAWSKFYATPEGAAVMAPDGSVETTFSGTQHCPYTSHVWEDIVCLNADSSSFVLLSSDGAVAQYNNGWSELATLPTRTWVALAKVGVTLYAMATTGEVYTLTVGGWAPSYPLTTEGNAVALVTSRSSGKANFVSLSTDGKIQQRRYDQALWLFKSDIEKINPTMVSGGDAVVTVDGRAYVFPGGDGEEAPTTTYNVLLPKYKTIEVDVKLNGGYLTISHPESTVTADVGASTFVRTSDQTLVFPGLLYGGTETVNRTLDLGFAGLTAGSVAITEKTQTGWSAPKVLAASALADTSFGKSVDIDATGTRFAVGADSMYDGAGEVYIYVRLGSGEWALEAALRQPSPLSGDHFGHALALSDDGTTLAVSAYGAMEKRFPVYIYRHTGTTWEFVDCIVQKTVPTWANTNATYLADNRNILDINGDGSVIVFGIPGYTVGALASAGAVSVIRRIGDDYTQDVILTASVPEAGAVLGRSVAISRDGVILIAGSPGATSRGKAAAGMACSWYYWAGSWVVDSNIQRRSDLETPSDRAGYCVSLSGDGSTLASTAGLSDYGGHTDVGSVSISYAP